MSDAGNLMQEFMRLNTMNTIKPEDTKVAELGERRFHSPLQLSTQDGDLLANYVAEEERVLIDISLCHVREALAAGREPPSLERAGPRQMIFHEPKKTKAGIVTCGGLCPGINDVIRGLVMELLYRYGIKSVYGFRYGYLGMVKKSGVQPLILDPEVVESIHEKGGTILGSSRGPQDAGEMVDRLMEFGVNIVFCIGGDGTLRGALDISNEVIKRGVPISVIGVPKTIDNDISFIEKTFGFETAFSMAVNVLRGAHVEAKGALNGVGLVKLMGRESGYIAANAALASGEVNFCLIPEVPFDLEGPNGFYSHLAERLQRRGHALVVVAEGAGQRFVEGSGTDASGNAKLGDIGVFLRDDMKRWLKQTGVDATVRYIDPSYIVRSAPANPADSIYCNQLAQAAVHAGMAGKTGMMVGLLNNQFIHVPIGLAVQKRKKIDPESDLWLSVLEQTGQPGLMVNATG